jgi:periplasmic copper chaperone A
MIMSRSRRSIPRRAGRRSPWLRRLGLLGLALLCATLAGCATGQTAETAQETPDTAGVDGAVGSMVLDDVYLETSDTVPVGGSVPLRAALTEDSVQADRLVSVSTPAADSVDLLTADGAVAADGIEVPGQGQVDATTGPVLLRLTGLTRPLSTQAIVPITFMFARAGSVTIEDVPVAIGPGGRA